MVMLSCLVLLKIKLLFQVGIELHAAEIKKITPYQGEQNRK